MGLSLSVATTVHVCGFRGGMVLVMLASAWGSDRLVPDDPVIVSRARARTIHTLSFWLSFWTLDFVLRGELAVTTHTHARAHPTTHPPPHTLASSLSSDAAMPALLSTSPWLNTIILPHGMISPVMSTSPIMVMTLPGTSWGWSWSKSNQLSWHLTCDTSMHFATIVR